jgi:lysophospholipase L1-like esterase
MPVISQHYVALGDSISIDVYAGGPGRGAASLLHRNRDDDFPDWTGRDLASAGYGFTQLARDGATSVDVLRRQLPALPGRVDLATVSMGGNDLLAGYGDLRAAERIVAAVAHTCDAVLAGLRRAAPAARVLVTTVYDPSDGTGRSGGSVLPDWPEGPAALALLNAALREAAGRYDAVVADVHAAFLGHGVAAGDPTQPQSRPADRELWYCGLIEPNAWGANGVRATWWAALEG